MKLSKLLLFRPEVQPSSAKRSALRLLAGFLVLMVLCTLLSRAADSITMPQVRAERPARAGIAHTVQASGVLQAGGETLVTAVDGILVDRIDAAEGRPVEVGEVILTLNGESLSKRLRTETMALQRQKLELNAQLLSGQLADQKEQLAYDRAYEDNSNAFDRSYRALEDARNARVEALQALRSYYAQHKEVIDRWTGTLPPGISQADEEVQQILARYYQLQNEYDAADSSYEAARDNRSDSWKSAERNLEDAQLALDWNIDKQGEILGLLLAMQEESVKELQRLAEDGGAVRSPIDGVVSQILVQPGSATTPSAAAMVAQKKGGYRFVAEIADQDELKYVEQGGTGSLVLLNSRPVKVTLDSVRDTTVTALLPDGTGELGARGVLEITNKTETYQTCVPMSALRSDGAQKYVMVLRETETVLGMQLTAERVDVQLLDSNETRAAVSGALMDDDRVIISSTKPVRTGDRVRLATQ